jgi:hypothetical protein
MMLFDSKMPTWPSGLNAAGTVPNGLRVEERLRLPEPHAFEARSADSDVGRVVRLGARERPGVEIPEPRLELGGRRAADLDLDAAEASGDRRLPDARVREIGEDPELGHLTPRCRIGERPDHQLRSS